MSARSGPGPVLRAAAVGGAVASAVVVASATLSSGEAHKGVALVALPLARRRRRRRPGGLSAAAPAVSARRAC